MQVDVVVFSAPQLSLYELRDLAALCDGRRFASAAARGDQPAGQAGFRPHGLHARIEDAGGTVLSGMCFYQSYAREIAEANGWKRLATNSAKLVNILGGYGYQPMLASMEALRRRRREPASWCDMTRKAFSARHAMGTHRARAGAGGATTAFRRATTSTASRGIFSRPTHKLAGQSYVGKILVLDTAKGGVATRLDAARDGIARHRCRSRWCSTP